MYKILVLGGEGMLGHMVKRVLSRKENLIVNSTHHEELTGSLFFNINDGIAGLRDIMVEQESFDYIINCIGIISSISMKMTQSQCTVLNLLTPYSLINLQV